MSKLRDKMITALKEIVVPILREGGFKGSFPHFRRICPDRIDLFTFQFDKWGGGFVIEIGQCPPKPVPRFPGSSDLIPVEKIRAWDLKWQQRFRIKPKAGSGREDWFRFDAAIAPGDFELVAQSVLPFITQADVIFAEFEKYGGSDCIAKP